MRARTWPWLIVAAVVLALILFASGAFAQPAVAVVEPGQASVVSRRWPCREQGRSRSHPVSPRPPFPSPKDLVDVAKPIFKEAFKGSLAEFGKDEKAINDYLLGRVERALTKPESAATGSIPAAVAHDRVASGR